MASLVDVFVQNKTTTLDVPTSTSKDEGVKEAPSLFDSLLSDTAKKLEKPQEEIKTTSNNTNALEKKESSLNNLDATEKNNIEVSETKIEKNLNSEEPITSQDMVENKAQKSLLDRLIIEAKGELSEDKTVSNNSLNKPNENLKNEPKLDDKSSKESDIEIVGEKTVDISTEENVKEDTSLEENSEKTENTKNPILPNDTQIKEETSNNSSAIIKDNKIQNEVINNEIIKTEISKEENKKNTTKKDNILNIENNQQKNEEIKIDNKASLDSNFKELQETVTSEGNTVIKSDNTQTSNDANKTIDNLLIPTTEDGKPILENNQLEEKVEPKKSLMDYLIEKNSQKNILEVQDTKVTNLSKDESVVSKDFVSNIYLGEQKNSMVNQFLFNKNEALKLLQNGSISLEDIEKSANILNLELDDVSVEQDTTIQTLKNAKQDLDLSSEKKNILDAMLSEKNIRSADIKNLITQSVEASSALLDNTLNVSNDVTVDINPTLLNNIQSRIIGAKQQMSQMMSDVARQMYENYKPPVTVFKINLNPVELGSISILMKNDKNNGLNISMSVSNMTTLDTLLGNQDLLRNSLAKTFNENTQFNLDFSSSSQNNRGNEQQSSNKQNRKFEDKIDTQTVLKLKEENKDRDDSLDYM
ncbi:flagellar hook-length control protein FliK [Aliarcobacter butzleri]|uniref:flagellar hook-length control protein FliK n=1 Tax=Aliarcobacter butzleri TaxID=28197 RepID=UPI001EE0C1B7|nr:flagellar hook-length control protein FliK [Aliarcobacter butzleri]MCG3698077.1 flagellar hook-length control protein FliK [Aliarcobacter butzleri]MCG3700061.1 flagellar hook-length control protein FliK [Aliarcobacter butzleri]MCT7650652.1 flagellar hook-length control protein FliK [Aliarcobacter butzleri]MDN5080951.1 flagellar hook-length control protein FliK [Aliarcobacter butzleri]MDN5091850.1 flagellar hook-length control protein FliK [Aliarcobacter butzleri]